MMSAADAAIASWALEPGVLFGLSLAAIIYLRGWLRVRRLAPHRFSGWQLAAFFFGLFTIYVAVASPLDAFANFLLSVHMIQHLLLTMVAPPLILLGAPFLPLLTGLPRCVRVDALGPFLIWPPLKRLGALLVHPAFAWPAFIISNVAWHLPPLYELALRSEFWHRAEHASFLGTAILFWWPVIAPWPSRMPWPRWTMIPYLLLADLQNTALAAFLSFYEAVLYPTYAAAPRISGLSAVQDQAAAGAIMWVPGSIGFFVPAGLIALEYLGPKRRTPLTHPVRRVATRPPRESALVPITRFLARRGRPILQIVLLALAALVVWDGFTGPQVGAMNAAGVLPWTHWRGFTVIGLLLAGNLFCMSCPFILVRDATRPLTRLLPHGKWPRALRSKFLPAVLLVIYLWAYEAFGLWDDPWITALIIVGYFAAVLVIDGIFSGGTFCKFVCPIGQFHFVQSLASPLEVRVREPDACRSCRTYDCLRGNATQRGCELELFQPRKAGNMDCTFCLDCVSACPKQNVSLLPVVPGADLWADGPRSSVRKFRDRPDLAALVAVLVFGAFANAAGMIAPVRRLQEASGLSHVVFTTIFLALALLVLPPLLLGAATTLSRQPGRTGDTPAFLPTLSRFTVALAPLGFAMWIAHFVFHLVTGLLTPIPVAQRLFGSADPDWALQSAAWPGLVGLEILILDAGFLLTLYALWRVARQPGGSPSRPVRAFLPWAILAAMLYAFGVWVIFQPMEMRGTLLPG